MERTLRLQLLSPAVFVQSVRRSGALFAARNLANFLRTLALPKALEQWSLTTLREKLVKIGARIVQHGRHTVFQLAEVAVPRGRHRSLHENRTDEH